MTHKNLLNRETAQEATKKLSEMDSVSSKMPLKKFIESNIDNFHRFIKSGNTKYEIYLFLRDQCELDLGSFKNFINVWRKCVKQRALQQNTPQISAVQSSVPTIQESQYREEEQSRDFTSKSQEPEAKPEVRTQRKNAGLPREKLSDGREIIMKNGRRTFEI